MEAHLDLKAQKETMEILDSQDDQVRLEDQVS